MSDDKRTQGGLSVKTLLIAGAASATAALVIPMVWRPGTVFAAAMTPVIVALVTEVLRRPVDTVSSVAARRTVRFDPVLDRDDEPFDPLAPPSAEELEALPRLTASQKTVHRRRPLTARQWKLALATGLVAFAGVVMVFTASELLAGDSVSRGSGRTTFFSGGSSKSDRQEKRGSEEEKATPTAPPAPTETPDETQEATPTPTPTATPTPAATPAPLTGEVTPTPTPPADATPVP